MKLKKAAAYLYAVLTAGIVAFQLALAAGAPWGSYAMGGSVSGTYPVGLRVAAVIQAVVLIVFGLVMLSRAGILLPSWRRSSRWAAWVAVGLGAVSLVLNLITPSAGERAVWAPVAVLMLASGLVVVLKTRQPKTTVGS